MKTILLTIPGFLLCILLFNNSGYSQTGSESNIKLEVDEGIGNGISNMFMSENKLFAGFFLENKRTVVVDLLSQNSIESYGIKEEKEFVSGAFSPEGKYFATVGSVPIIRVNLMLNDTQSFSFAENINLCMYYPRDLAIEKWSDYRDELKKFLHENRYLYAGQNTSGLIFDSTRSVWYFTPFDITGFGVEDSVKKDDSKYFQMTFERKSEPRYKGVSKLPAPWISNRMKNVAFEEFIYSKNFRWALLALKTDGKKIIELWDVSRRQLKKSIVNSSNQILSENFDALNLSDDGSSVIIRRSEPKGYSYYKVNLKNGNGKLLFKNELNFKLEHYAFDKNNNIMFISNGDFEITEEQNKLIKLLAAATDVNIPEYSDEKYLFKIQNEKVDTFLLQQNPNNLYYEPQSNSLFIIYNNKLLRRSLANGIEQEMIFPKQSHLKKIDLIRSDKTGNSDTLVICSKNSIRYFNLMTFKQDLYYNLDNADILDFDSKNQMLAIANNQKREVSIFDIIDHRKLSIPLNEYNADYIRLNPGKKNSGILAIKSNDQENNTAHLLKFENEKFDTLRYRSNASLVWDSLDRDGNAQYHYVSSQETKTTNQMDISSAAFSKDGDKFVTFSNPEADGFLQSIELSIMDFKNSQTDSTEMVNKLIELAKMKFVPGQVRLWNTHDSISSELFFHDYQEENLPLVLDSKGELLFCPVHHDKKIKVWNIINKHIVGEIYYCNDFIDNKDALPLNTIEISPDNQRLIISDKFNNITSYKLNISDTLQYDVEWTFTAQTECVSIKCMPGEKSIAIGYIDGSVEFVKEKTGEPYMKLFFGESENDYVVEVAGNYYISGKAGLKRINFFDEDKIYDYSLFEQFYNRPDAVVWKYANNVFSDSSDLTKRVEYALKYNMAWRNRILLAGMDPEDQIFVDLNKYISRERPKLIIKDKKNIFLNQLDTTGSVVIDFEMHSQKFKISSLNIIVNGVSIYGRNGKKVNKTDYIDSQKILLTNGINKIEVSCLSENGMESKRELLNVYSYKCNIKKPKLFLVVIGVNEYEFIQKERWLNYCINDGKQLISAFDSNNQLKNVYDTIIAITYFNQDATLKNISRVKNLLLNSSVNDELIFLFSGHGVLDSTGNFYFATYDIDISKQFKNGLSYFAIENILDSIPLRKKLLLIDACHSGIAFKEAVHQYSLDSLNDSTVADKTVTLQFHKKEIEKIVDDVLDWYINVNKSNGMEVIAAASGYGSSREGKIFNNGTEQKINNGIFTYCVLDGLKNAKADLNGDKTITIAELKSYLMESVYLRSNKSQKPVFRNENIDTDWSLWKVR